MSAPLTSTIKSTLGTGCRLYRKRDGAAEVRERSSQKWTRRSHDSGTRTAQSSATESWFRYASISERARSVTRPPHLGFLSNNVYTMADGQGGVGSRFSLRA